MILSSSIYLCNMLKGKGIQEVNKQNLWNCNSADQPWETLKIYQKMCLVEFIISFCRTLYWIFQKTSETCSSAHEWLVHMFHVSIKKKERKKVNFLIFVLYFHFSQGFGHFVMCFCHVYVYIVFITFNFSLVYYYYFIFFTWR